jgi:Uncharacterised nucleotidyltransferase
LTVNTVSQNLQLPPAQELHGILRRVTETLAEELANPAAHAPQWSAFEWCAGRAVAAMHGVSPLLSRISSWDGDFGWKPFIDQQRMHTAKRHERIRELLAQVDGAMRTVRVSAVALKGAALHDIGLYVPGDRPMADLDILVRPSDAARTAKLLEALGFIESSSSWKERVFVPRLGKTASVLGEHASNDIKVELHTRICERLPWSITDVSEVIFAPSSGFGLNGYSSTAWLMLHLLLHAAGSMTTRALRLLHLYDISLVAARMEHSDWQQLLEYGNRAKLWWAFPPLGLVSKYFVGTVPQDVLDALAAQCPYFLKRGALRKKLYDYSLSYLWTDALPGIEWSRSLSEMGMYAANRLKPSGDHLALRKHIADTQPWAMQDSWQRSSQARRIVRWISAPQPRTVAVHALQAAMACDRGS